MNGRRLGATRSPAAAATCRPLCRIVEQTCNRSARLRKEGIVLVRFVSPAGLLTHDDVHFIYCFFSISALFAVTRPRAAAVVLLLAAFGLLSSCDSQSDGPGIATASEPIDSPETRQHLEAIGLAITNFEDEERVFPSSTTKSDGGDAETSWRIAILPYLGHESLYDSYDQSLPFDAPINQLHQKQRPAEFVCPLANLADKTQTTFVMPVGPGTMGDGNELTLSDVLDGRSTTIFAIDSYAHPTVWTSPQDVAVQPVTKWVPGEQPAFQGFEPFISDAHGGAVTVLCADGSVKTVHASKMTPYTFNSALTRDGSDVTSF